MEERLIREMVKLRGGPTRLKALCKEYDKNIEQLSMEKERFIYIRDLIVKLTSVESPDEDVDEPEPSEEEES